MGSRIPIPIAMTNLFRSSTFVNLLMGIAIAAGASSCTTQTYREVRRPVPGGGYYVQRIPIPQEQLAGARQKKGKGMRKPGTGWGGFSFNWFGPKAQQPPTDDGSYWIGDTMTGAPSMRISLSEQRVFYYKGGKLAGVSPTSTGREGYRTSPGSYSVIQKDLDHKSSFYGDYVAADGRIVKSDVDVRKDARPPGSRFDGANMRYFMRVTGAIGMHEGYLPGFPASHGCIRLPSKMAEVFFRASPLGTPVEIVR